MNKDFFRRLYHGFEAEYFVTGKFFAAGYEAFKMPADFGFDLMVTNQKETTLDCSDKRRKISFPYAVQVKSKKLKPEDIKEGTGSRDQIDTKITIKSEELKSLIENPNSFLIVVLFLDFYKTHRPDQTMLLWFESSHVKKLHKLGYFVERPPNDGRKRLLNIRVRLFPMLEVDELIKKLGDEISKTGGEIIQKELGSKVPKNWNAKEYLMLKHKVNNKTTWSKVPDELTNLNKIGHSIDLDDLN